MKKDKFIQIKKDKNHKKKKILVNTLTGIRASGSLFVVPAFFSASYLCVGALCAMFFLTDFVDGFLARKLHVQSFFGSFLDAISDKLFGIVCLCLLATLNPIFYAVIASEMAISIVNCASVKKGNNVQSSMVGKAKTWVLGMAIVGSFLGYALPSLQQITSYAESAILTKLASINPQTVSTILGSFTLGASLSVLGAYRKESKKQTEKRLEEIKEERKKLQEEKKELVRKSKQEIVHDLFDTAFYLENKEEPILKLLYK